MSKEPHDYIEEYYESIKDKYPHLSYSDVEHICRSYFKVLKEEMTKGTLKTVRFKYFGTFNVYRSRAIGLLNKTKKMHEENKVNAETVEYIKGIVANYLKTQHNETLSH
jgi:nucleoid DNA-binding protein